MAIAAVDEAVSGPCRATKKVTERVLNPDVRFTIDGKPVSINDIKPGMLVTVYADQDAWRRHSVQSPDAYVVEKPNGSAASTIWGPVYTPGEATPRYWELGRQSP